MPIPYYGLLTGKLLGLVAQHGRNPHFLLSVQAGTVEYKVSLNVQSTHSTGHVTAPSLQYQVVDNLAQSKLSPARKLVAAISNTNSLQLADQHPSLPRLDYVRGGFLDLHAFTEAPTAATVASNPFLQKLTAAVDRATKDHSAFVAVFGQGHSTASNSGTVKSISDPLTDAFGFTGVENVHMNQGSDLKIGRHLNNQFKENGPNQDGAVLFFFSDKSVQAFFLKFSSQDIETNAHGNPTHTGIAEFDKVAKQKKLQPLLENPFPKMLAKPAPRPAKRPSPSGRVSVPPPSPSARITFRQPHDAPVGGAAPGPVVNSSGFVFNDPTPADPNHVFDTDDDSAVRNSPFVQNFASNGVPEPVPGPRNNVYPVMKLEDVLGTPAVNAIANTGQTVFHAVGDTGAPTLEKLPNETMVTDLMTSDLAAAAPTNRPGFLFHLGDVVYFYGESQFYYDQFFKPFKDYAAPIFAIPGNHDGITYNASMVSLAGFLEVFCDSAPSHPQSAGGIQRTSMTQPSVYFTLDAPLVSIIGLYSNCSESYGYLDSAQKLFLYSELTRLKPLRTAGTIAAVVLAVHHPPLSYSTQKPSSTELRDSIDTACSNAGLYPDAVLSGHAHIYQRIVRTMGSGSSAIEIPYIIAGAGGYAMNPQQEIQQQEMKLQDVSDPQYRLHQFLKSFGYLNVIVRSKSFNQSLPAGQKLSVPTLRLEYHSTEPGLATPADACTVDLQNHQIL
jgi:uncharacterized protein YukJ